MTDRWGPLQHLGGSAHTIRWKGRAHTQASDVRLTSNDLAPFAVDPSNSPYDVLSRPGNRRIRRTPKDTVETINTHTRAHTKCTNLHTHTCIPMHTHTEYKHTHSHMHTHTHSNEYTHIHNHTCTYTYMHTQMHMHTYKHTHMHTYM